MIPGAPRNQREMQMMMRRLGMSTEPIENVEEVVIRTKTKEHVFDKPEVTILTVQGVKTYQVVGKATVRPASAASARAAEPAAPAAPEPKGPPEEDIRLVMDQAAVSREEALEALADVDQECIEAYLYSRAPTRILLFRRPPARDRIWVPVSGKVEPSDPDFVAAARRELEEETGLADPVRLESLEWTFPFTGPDGRRWRLHAFAVEVPPGWTPRLSSEHEAYAWCAPEEAMGRLHYEDNREALRILVRRVTG